MAGSQAAAEVVALQGHGDRHVSSYLDEPGQRNCAEPGAVLAQVGAGEVEKGRDLVFVGRQVASDVFVGECRPFVRPPARVADLGGGVPDYEHDVVAHTLEAAEQQHGDGMAQVHVRPGRVDPQLGHKAPALQSGLHDPPGKGVRRGLQLLAAIGHEPALLRW